MVLTQTYDPDLVYNQTNGLYSLEFFEDWLSDFFNVAYTNENDDVSLFEYVKEGLYTGHYFFNSRGKEAFKVAREVLNEFFSHPEVKAVQGFTPLHLRHARWFSRNLGFSSYGVIHLNEPCEHFILTRPEWEQINGKDT